MALAIDYAHELDRPPVVRHADRLPRRPLRLPGARRLLRHHRPRRPRRLRGRPASPPAPPDTLLTTQRAALRALGLRGARPPLELARTDPRAYIQALRAAGEDAELIDGEGLGGFGWLAQTRRHRRCRAVPVRGRRATARSEATPGRAARTPASTRGSAASRRPGAPRSSAPSDSASSIRASGAPRQKWMPAPKPTWGFGSRARSRRPGSAKTSGSRLAEANCRATSCAARDRHARDLDVLQHPALEHRQRGVVAQQLLDRGRDQAVVGAQAFEALRVAEQRPPGVAGGVHGRLVAGVEQQHAGADQLVLAEALAPRPSALIRSSPGSRTPGAGQLAQVAGELHRGAHRGALDLVGGVQLVHAADVGRPGAQQRPVGLGDAEHLGDHGHRQRLGDLGDQVAAAVARPARATRPSASSRTRARSPSAMRGVNALDTSRRSRVWSGGSTSSMPAR